MSENLFEKIFKFYLHDKPTELGNINKDYYYDFLKSFAFWKFYLLIFLGLIIGIINLISKKPVNEELNNEYGGYWITEWILLTLAFFIPCIFMYLIRDPRNNNFTIWNMIKTFGILLFLCFFKHLDFQLSGLYRWKFGSKKCSKYKEHFSQEDKKCSLYFEHFSQEDKKEEDKKEEDKKEEDNKEEETKCKCDDSIFDGPVWDGLGWYGLFFTFFILYFFIASLIESDLTKKIFGIEFTKIYLVLCIFLIIGIFLTGFFLIKTFKNKDCSNNNIFNSLRDGGACVTVVFTTIITLLPLYILIKWYFECRKNKTCNFNDKLKYSYGTLSQFKRFIIVFIEIIVTWIIFILVEAGIESMRKKEVYTHIISNKDVWFSSSSAMTFLAIAYLQIILEYSGWFYMHLFKKH